MIHVADGPDDGRGECVWAVLQSVGGLTQSGGDPVVHIEAWDGEPILQGILGALQLLQLGSCVNDILEVIFFERPFDLGQAILLFLWCEIQSWERDS